MRRRVVACYLAAGAVAFIQPARTTRRSLVRPKAVASASTGARTSRYVDDLLEAVAGTDRGVRASDDARRLVDGLIARLERSYAGEDAAATPELLYRESEVLYVGQRSSRRANAAGGRFRGRFGRLLFKTIALHQHVLQEAGGVIAVNQNRFRFLGVIPGSAVLTGAAVPETELEALGEKWNRTLSANTLRASFGQPRVKLGPLVFGVGPESTVRLDTTYLDDRIRISRGGSTGTPFVFGTCAADDSGKDAWRAVSAAEPVSARRAGVAVGAAALVAAGGAARAATRIAWAPAACLALLAGKLLTSTGGIVARDPAVKTYTNAGYGG